MVSVWDEREMKVLKAVAEIEEADDVNANVGGVAEKTGLPADAVVRSIRALMTVAT